MFVAPVVADRCSALALRSCSILEIGSAHGYVVGRFTPAVMPKLATSYWDLGRGGATGRTFVARGGENRDALAAAC